MAILPLPNKLYLLLVPGSCSWSCATVDGCSPAAVAFPRCMLFVVKTFRIGCDKSSSINSLFETSNHHIVGMANTFETATSSRRNLPRNCWNQNYLRNYLQPDMVVLKICQAQANLYAASGTNFSVHHYLQLSMGPRSSRDFCFGKFPQTNLPKLQSHQFTALSNRFHGTWGKHGASPCSMVCREPLMVYVMHSSRIYSSNLCNIYVM